MIQTDILLAAAVTYASWGWPVFRLIPGGKKPLPRTHGYLDATSDVPTVVAMWRQTPDANIGIATGKAAGIWVLDVDTKDGKQGMRSLGQLCSLTAHRIMNTATAKTYSGGLHLYYRYPEGREIDRRIGAFKRLGMPDLDVIGNNGYIVAPPSVVGDGGYGWLTDDLVDTPPELLAALAAADMAIAIRKAERAIHPPRAHSADGLLRWLARREPGVQDDALAWAVRTLRDEGYTETDVEQMVRPILAEWPTSASGQPWTEGDIQRQLRSAFR